MFPPDDNNASWPTGVPRAQRAAGAGFDPDAPIEVLEPDDVLGVGLGSDILVVDDDPATLAAYEAALAPLGRTTVAVGSGVAALARLLEQDFALAVLDVSMPEMTGLETARRIRERARNRGLPILFATGVEWSTDVVLEAYDAGASDFMTKPILPEVLRAKVRGYLRLQDWSRSLRRRADELRLAERRLDEADRITAGHAAELARRDHDAARRQDELLAMLGHELRNPLWAAVNALELLKQRGEPLGPELAVIERQLGHLAHIVGDLVDVARVTHGKIALRREAVQLSAAVGEALESVRAFAESHRHRIAVDVAPDLLVDADRHRLRQVLAILVTNAIENTDDRGSIELTARRGDTTIELAVRDNGRGISSALLPDLFELFVQGERQLARSEGGVGVGLTLARTLVALHGGEIAAHSDGPGRGATFVVRWPVATLATPTAEMAPLTRPPPTAARRILLADDNTDAAEMLAALLEALGHDVRVVHDGRAALDAAADFAPHVALLDIGLPEIDGFELAGRLRALPACRATLLIAITGYGQPEDRARSRAAGFAHHLVKPVEIASLAAAIAGAPSDGATP